MSELLKNAANMNVSGPGLQPRESAPLKCPTCNSEAVCGVRADLSQAKCADCGRFYDIHFPTAQIGAPNKKPPRQVVQGKHHDREKGPAEPEISVAPPLGHQELGEMAFNLMEIRKGGAKALIAARKEAIRLGKRFGEEVESKWFLKTVWLQQLQVTHRGRARVNYALRWRPRFLATLALSGSVMIACKAAPVDFHTYQRHRKEDVDFDAQCNHADLMAAEMLHAACFASAVEGDLEPVYWQGKKVGHIRKFDSRLRIEMLRAHLPKLFKTPGAANVNINAVQSSQAFVIGPEVQAELVAQRRRNLLAMKAAREAGNPHPELPVE